MNRAMCRKPPPLPPAQPSRAQFGPAGRFAIGAGLRLLGRRGFGADVRQAPTPSVLRGEVGGVAGCVLATQFAIRSSKLEIPNPQSVVAQHNSQRNGHHYSPARRINVGPDEWTPRTSHCSLKGNPLATEANGGFSKWWTAFWLVKGNLRETIDSGGGRILRQTQMCVCVCVCVCVLFSWYPLFACFLKRSQKENRSQFGVSFVC